MVKARAKDSSLTPADIAAGKRLRAIWDRKAKTLGLTQDKAGEALEMTQGAVGHYLNQRTALGVKATLQFAKLLKVDPLEIRSDLAGLDAAPSQPAGRPDAKFRAAVELLYYTLSNLGKPLELVSDDDLLDMAYEAVVADGRDWSSAVKLDLNQRLAKKIREREAADAKRRAIEGTGGQVGAENQRKGKRGKA